jgi:hypothetical protein
LAAVLVALIAGVGAVASASSSQTGSYIAYIGGGAKSPPSVWIANANGSDPHRLTVGDEALLSPNGAYVAVQRVANSGVSLEIYGTDGKLLAGFFNAAKDSATALQWSPDSAHLVASLMTTKTVGGGALELIDMSTLKSRLVSKGVIAGASFNPAGTQLVFGMSTSLQISVPVDLYTTAVAGGGVGQLTTNGNSFAPIWTQAGIVFDRSTPRGVSRAPIYQLWIYSSGTLRQLTHMRVPALLDGLEPLEASADGQRLIAEYGGQDTSYAWTVQLSPLRVKPLKVAGQYVQGEEISRDGRRLLIDTGAFEQSPNHGEVESVGFGGGAPTKLVRGTQPSWSG